MWCLWLCLSRSVYSWYEWADKSDCLIKILDSNSLMDRKYIDIPACCAVCEGITNPTWLRALNTRSNQNPKGWTLVEQSLHQFNLLDSRPWRSTWEHQIEQFRRNVCTCHWHYRVKQTLIQTRSQDLHQSNPLKSRPWELTWKQHIKQRLPPQSWTTSMKGHQQSWANIVHLHILSERVKWCKKFICKEIHWQSCTHISEIFV